MCCLLFFAAACYNGNAYSKFTLSKKDSLQNEKNVAAAFDSIQLYKKLVKPGDIIFRTGKDFASETMRLLSAHDKTYSHCGIASIEHDSLFVYHSIGGEWNPNQQLRRDPFEFFCNPYENRGFGIFRYKLNAQANNKLISVVQTFYTKKIQFDMQFDLSTDDKMYCSEFVYKSIEQAISNKIILPTTTVHHIKFIALDNLFMNPLCSQIKRVTFQNN